jgi:hypothetical protein
MTRLRRPREDTAAVKRVVTDERAEADVFIRFREDTGNLGALSSFFWEVAEVGPIRRQGYRRQG